jgi:uncharacterized RDD family membrane protein YckC
VTVDVPPPPPPPPSAASAPVRAEPATWGSRVLAVLIDAFLLLIPFSLLESMFLDGIHVRLLVHVPSYAGPWWPDGPWALWVVSVLLWLTYVVVTESRRAATPGKAARGIRVVDLHGSAASTRQVWLRNLAKVTFAVTFVLGILDDLWPLWDAERQALHDKVAGTYVVNAAP